MATNKKSDIKHTTGGAAFTDIVLEIFRLNGRIIAAGDELVGELGLTSARWQVMGAAEGEEPLTVSQIARKMGLKRQSVQRIVDVLVNEGLLVLIDNPSHQRAKLVKLSVKGKNLLKKVEKLQCEWANSIAAGLDTKELKCAHDVIRELRVRLEN
ncbi:MarR family transcriptional regulator [Pseudomaricurvus alkylphenolicus]|uniref:MarR family winged helix-turn-helix transcriptional regulator n=1 Tax=Pseudomaricurvus alkylphenolicus TaxID=1306991 RepID=UPI00142302DD|nr:MarR family transcriptional regulator [Pseudomaricurvus alkylphenolicus]NIB38372.1 MarR family transcriptional regulator [Pseudomaricurvus alkylphenolicus]